MKAKQAAAVVVQPDDPHIHVNPARETCRAPAQTALDVLVTVVPAAGVVKVITSTGANVMAALKDGKPVKALGELAAGAPALALGALPVAPALAQEAVGQGIGVFTEKNKPSPSSVGRLWNDVKCHNGSVAPAAEVPAAPLKAGKSVVVSETKAASGNPKIVNKWSTKTLNVPMH
jgi:hypothetical protein